MQFARFIQCGAIYKKRAIFYGALGIATLCIWFSRMPDLQRIALPAIFFYLPASASLLIHTLLKSTPATQISQRHIGILNKVMALTGVALVSSILAHDNVVIAQIGVVVLLAIPEMELTASEEAMRDTISTHRDKEARE